MSNGRGRPATVHVISFGKWIPAQSIADDEDKPLPLKVRAPMVDGRVQEHSLGPVHKVTERLFVVWRANDAEDEEE